MMGSCQESTQQGEACADIKNGAGTLGEVARTIKFGVVSCYGKPFERTREYRLAGISSGMGW